MVEGTKSENFFDQDETNSPAIAKINSFNDATLKMSSIVKLLHSINGEAQTNYEKDSLVYKVWTEAYKKFMEKFGQACMENDNAKAVQIYQQMCTDMVREIQSLHNSMQTDPDDISRNIRISMFAAGTVLAAIGGFTVGTLPILPFVLIGLGALLTIASLLILEERLLSIVDSFVAHQQSSKSTGSPTQEGKIEESSIPLAEKLVKAKTEIKSVEKMIKEYTQQKQTAVSPESLNNNRPE